MAKIELKTQGRSRAFMITYEVLNAVTHGLGFFAAIVGAVFMLLKVFSQPASGLTIGAVILYLSTVSLFLLASTLFHSLVFTRAASIFQFFDHAGIYLVILGTYTPYMWLIVGGTVGWSIWWAILALTIAGFGYDLFFVGRWPKVAVTIYLVMGWLVLLAFPWLYASLSALSFWLLLAGGLTYSAGTLFYLIKKIPMAHLYWHGFVMGGATLMYLSIYLAL